MLTARAFCDLHLCPGASALDDRAIQVVNYFFPFRSRERIRVYLTFTLPFFFQNKGFTSFIFRCFLLVWITSKFEGFLLVERVISGGQWKDWSFWCQWVLSCFFASELWAQGPAKYVAQRWEDVSKFCKPQILKNGKPQPQNKLNKCGTFQILSLGGC